MTDPLLKKVRNTIFQHRMILPGERIVVAVSGGPDSTCLLDILNRLGKELGLALMVAHFNHGFRSEEDDLETQQVKALADRLALPFVAQKADMALNRERSSLEERARKARYHFLESVRTQNNAAKIAIGHTMNDQAETVIMRLLRGSGPSGLGGIPPVRDRTIIRPLLYIKRSEIEEYLKSHHLSSSIDPSNLKPIHLRNRIRHEILPLLTQQQPNLIEQLSSTADILRAEDDFLHSLAQDWVQKAGATEELEAVSLSIDAIQSLHTALKNRVLRVLIEKTKKDLLGIGYNHILAISNLISSDRPQGRLNLPGGLVAVKAYDRLEMRLHEIRPADYQYIIDGPGRYYIPEIERTLTLTVSPNSSLVKQNQDESIAYLDADKIHFPLVVRKFLPGDRFIPLGLRGHKKIKDFFIDLKVPDKDRSSIPFLVCGHIPVWVCGYRIDDRFKVTPPTKRVLKAVLLSGP